MDEADDLTWLLGAVTTQGYLLEILLSAQFANRADPLADLENIRAKLQKLLKFDMRVPPTDNPRANHLEIQTVALKHLDETLDRCRTYLAHTAS